MVAAAAAVVVAVVDVVILYCCVFLSYILSLFFSLLYRPPGSTALLYSVCVSVGRSSVGRSVAVAHSAHSIQQEQRGGKSRAL